MILPRERPRAPDRSLGRGLLEGVDQDRVGDRDQRRDRLAVPVRGPGHRRQVGEHDRRRDAVEVREVVRPDRDLDPLAAWVRRAVLGAGGAIDRDPRVEGLRPGSTANAIVREG